MTEKDFMYWLQGFFELSGATSLNEDQVKVLKEHVALVMKKVTPSQMPLINFPVLPNLPYVPPTLVPPTVVGDRINMPLPKFDNYEIICSTAEPIKDIPTALSC